MTNKHAGWCILVFNNEKDCFQVWLVAISDKSKVEKEFTEVSGLLPEPYSLKFQGVDVSILKKYNVTENEIRQIIP